MSKLNIVGVLMLLVTALGCGQQNAPMKAEPKQPITENRNTSDVRPMADLDVDAETTNGSVAQPEALANDRSWEEFKTILQKWSKNQE